MFRRPSQPEALIEKIQAGDETLRNQFIAESVPEIKHWVRRITHSYFAEQEDEFSVALDGFNQAISRFSSSLDVPFYSYANMLVKHRLFDWMRRDKHNRNTRVFSDCDSEDGIPIEERLADPQSEQFGHDLEINESLLQLEIHLQSFGFSLNQITGRFPKHRPSQMFCIQAARHLSSDQTLMVRLMAMHRLPGAELAKRCQVSVKTIEKNRSSIILLALLMRSDLELIHSYISAFEKEAQQ